MCNYGITEMPDQNVAVSPVATIKDQLFTEERRVKNAQLEEQAKKADNAVKTALEAKNLKRKRMLEAKEAMKKET